MARYHINPETGNPGFCRAKKNCPFGGDNDHFPTREEARKAAEAELAKEYSFDVTTAEPAAIDSRLADLYQERIKLYATEASREWSLELSVKNAKGISRRDNISEVDIQAFVEECRERSKKTHVENGVIEAAERLAAIREQLDANYAAQKPYADEFDRRGGWTRAFLVTNGNGHVHRSMQCSTCRPTTQYHWVTEYSGKSQDEVVNDAGERACTVCYPDAPVNVLSRASKIFSPDEKKKLEDREARVAAKAAKDKEKIAKALTLDGSEFVIQHDTYGTGRMDKERFKTERSATTWLVDQLSAPRTWRSTPLSPSTLDAIDQVKEALAIKQGKTIEEIDAMLESKVQAKVKRFNS